MSDVEKLNQELQRRVDTLQQAVVDLISTVNRRDDVRVNRIRELATELDKTKQQLEDLKKKGPKTAEPKT